MTQQFISIKGAKEHNLKEVNINIPKNKLIVVTGVSGSGKSSLAFDTIYAEGKRRYMNSLSTYTRHLEMHNKPSVESIDGLSPAIAIEQKNSTKNPRSTVATVTEIYDYLRVLFSRVGVPYSPVTGQIITKHTPAEIINEICALPSESKIFFVVPTHEETKNDHRKTIIYLRKQGCKDIIVDDVTYSMEDLPLLDRHKEYKIEGVLTELVITSDIECRQEVIAQVYRGLGIGRGIIYIDIVDGNKKARMIFSEKYCCPASGFQIDEIAPRLFSFNSPHGACKTCDGLGIENVFDIDLVVPDKSLSLNEGAIAPWKNILSKTATLTQKRTYQKILEQLAKHYDFSIDAPFYRLSPELQNIIIYGSNDIIDFSGGINKAPKQFEGIIPMLEKEMSDTNVNYISDELCDYQISRKCSKCNGTRLREEALALRIANHNIGTICTMTIVEMYDWFNNLNDHLDTNQKHIAEKIIQEVTKRLSFLVDIGVGYLTLNRRSATLSGGESQRIKIASQLGCGLDGLIYVLDEPSIGLHQSDNDKLLSIMRGLCDIGNTVIVVEHDEDTIKMADYLIDMGPEAGKNGGYVIAEGTPKEVAKNPNSITGKYLSGELTIDMLKERRSLENSKFVEIIGASSFNLKDIDVKVPLNCFVVVTGVSGSGKSTFAIHTLYKALAHQNKKEVGTYKQMIGSENIDKVIQVDQSPIGRTPRSNPITYVNAFTMIRECYAAQHEARNLGYNTGCFSFNVKGGRCESCEGDGVIKIEMHFMSDVYISCEACNGMRYNSQILQIKYKGKSIADILNMTVDEVVEIFADIPLINEKLVALQEVGLGYLKVGQSATTLSGGEAQRIKLAKELSKRSIGNTLYVFDEPTTGLHMHDIQKLLKVLHKLVDNGNSVLIIEHNLDVIKNADHIIDFGPQGGNLGGIIVASGTPEEVALNERSLTGKYLKQHLKL